MKHFLGVLGGMGPLATADFLRSLAENTPARVDQNHIPVLLYGDCTTPDRTESVIGVGPSPLPALLRGIRFLSGAGVRAICVPCNSAHSWFAEMEAESSVPLLNMVRASAEQVRTRNPSARTVGVLSTRGTWKAGIYEPHLRARGYAVVTPTDAEFDALVSPGIAAVKANDIPFARGVLGQAAGALMQRGAEIIILACTEIPLGMREQCADDPSRFVDSTEALARSAVEYYFGT